MILDALQMFDSPSAPRDLAQVAGNYASTNILDYGLIDPCVPAEGAGTLSRDMGIGTPLNLFCQVTEVFAGGTSLQVALQGSISDASGDPASWSTWWQSPAYATASLATVGVQLFNMAFPRPPAGIAIPRFVRLLYSIVGTMTAGEVVAGVVLDRPDQFYSSTNNAVLGGYPSGITVAN